MHTKMHRKECVRTRKTMNVVSNISRRAKVSNWKCWWRANESLERPKFKLSCILESTQKLAQELEKIDYKLSNSTIAQFLVWFETRTSMITIMCLYFLNVRFSSSCKDGACIHHLLMISKKKLKNLI